MDSNTDKKPRKKRVVAPNIIELTDEEKALTLDDASSSKPTDNTGYGEPQLQLNKARHLRKEGDVPHDSIKRVIATTKEFKIDKNHIPLRLNPRQKRFCEAYVINYDATEAAKLAGYNATSDNGFAVQGYTNLKHKGCRLYIAELQELENSLADLKLSKDYHIQSLLELKAILNKDKEKNVNQLLKIEEQLIKLSGNSGNNNSKQQMEYDLTDAFGVDPIDDDETEDEQEED